MSDKGFGFSLFIIFAILMTFFYFAANKEILKNRKISIQNQEMINTFLANQKVNRSGIASNSASLLRIEQKCNIN